MELISDSQLKTLLSTLELNTTCLLVSGTTSEPTTPENANLKIHKVVGARPLKPDLNIWRDTLNNGHTVRFDTDGNVIEILERL